MNRGSAAHELVVEQAQAASMRPRFMNRGSLARPNCAESARFASMRPRFMNRGSIRVKRIPNMGIRRFNEAPIHESGKFPTPSKWKAMVPCFNEAPIHESGKC